MAVECTWGSLDLTGKSLDLTTQWYFTGTGKSLDLTTQWYFTGEVEGKEHYDSFSRLGWKSPY